MDMPPVALVALLLGSMAPPALADVYTYVASNKVLVLTNLRPQGEQVEVLVAEPAVAAAVVAGQGGARTVARRSDFDALIDAAARAFSIDSALIHAVISVESGYVVNARSPRGASGLMQLMPETAREYGASDPFDPVQNINGGARYLKYLLDKYDNRLETALAAYNAGEKALARHGGKVPPWRETLRYVDMVRERYLRNQRAAGNR